MSRSALISQWKRENLYSADGERCGNCVYCKKGYTKLVNSLPRTVRPYCALGGFHVNNFSICDRWQKKD